MKETSLADVQQFYFHFSFMLTAETDLKLSPTSKWGRGPSGRTMKPTGGVGGSILFPFFWFWVVPTWVGAAPAPLLGTPAPLKQPMGHVNTVCELLGWAGAPAQTTLPCLSPTGEVTLRVCVSPLEDLGAWLGWEGPWGHVLSLSVKLSRESSEVMRRDKQ